MNKELNILMLEDSAGDAALINHELRKCGFPYHFKQVEANDEFLAELRQRPPDLVLSDHGIPSFDGFTVLALVRDRFPDVPFIFVSGSNDERVISKALDNGASDWIPKHRLSDLVPAVKRALREADVRQRLMRAEAERDRLATEVQGLKSRFESMQHPMPMCSSCKKIRDDHNEWQPVDNYLRDHAGLNFSHGICPECVQKYFTGFI
jgi:CheY-like chemotaxis protein